MVIQGICVAWTETEGLSNMSLCLFGATHVNLTHSDKRMGVGEISIQRQRVFTLADALRGSLREYADHS
jgi:hypothetical protein